MGYSPWGHNELDMNNERAMNIVSSSPKSFELGVLTSAEIVQECQFRADPS